MAKTETFRFVVKNKDGIVIDFERFTYKRFQSVIKAMTKLIIELPFLFRNWEKEGGEIIEVYKIGERDYVCYQCNISDWDMYCQRIAWGINAELPHNALEAAF